MSLGFVALALFDPIFIRFVAAHAPANDRPRKQNPSADAALIPDASAMATSDPSKETRCY